MVICVCKKTLHFPWHLDKKEQTCNTEFRPNLCYPRTLIRFRENSKKCLVLSMAMKCWPLNMSRVDMNGNLIGRGIRGAVLAISRTKKQIIIVDHYKWRHIHLSPSDVNVKNKNFLEHIEFHFVNIFLRNSVKIIHFLAWFVDLWKLENGTVQKILQCTLAFDCYPKSQCLKQSYMTMASVMNKISTFPLIIHFN